MKKIWTEIVYIGHANEKPEHEQIAELKATLKEYTLEPDLEGLFAKHSTRLEWIDKNYPLTKPTPVFWKFFGNFFNLSKCFKLYTNDPELVDELNTLIYNNQQTTAYKKARQERQVQNENYKKSFAGL